jgi:hypothetical protein
LEDSGSWAVTNKFSDFYTTKNAMVEPTCQMLQKFKNSGKIIKIVRYDDGGGNKAPEQEAISLDWKSVLVLSILGEILRNVTVYSKELSIL